MVSAIPNPLSVLRQFGLLQSTNWSLSECPRLTGKVAVITGGQGGIGAEITKQLLLNDIAHVVVLARSRERFEKARDGIWAPALEKHGVERARVERVRFVECDLSDLRVVEAVGKELAEGGLERLDMLFLNAAAPWSPTYTLSPQGIDSIFASNHLGHHHLTLLLLPLLTSTPLTHGATSTRIIITTSSIHTFCRTLSLSSLTSPTRTTSFGPLYDAVYRYARSKLANILFAHSLTARLPPNVFANSFFPGNIPTEAMDSWKTVVGPLGGVVAGVFRVVGQSLQDGAATAVFLGAAQQVELGGYRGEYWVPVANIEECSRVACDERLAERLWAWCEKVGEKVRAQAGEGVKAEDAVTGEHVGYVHQAHPTPAPM